MIGIFMILASLLLSIGLIFFSSRTLSKRVSEISRDMDRVAAGDLAFESAISGNDEIGQLAQDLNMMVKSINVLVHEAYDANLEKNQLLMEQKEIKLAMLANQINPHFLFNALEAVRMKAISLGDRDTARIIKLLARLMRINLSLGSELIPLRRELEQVESYLEIQKFRYGSKVDYRISLADDTLLDCLILPLIIQPVVENAFTHGLENKEGPGCVAVDISMLGKDLMIRVSDDGIGIESDKLSLLTRLDQEQDDRDEKKIGLRNISQRIMLYYGAAFGLELTSSPSQGTAVTIRIPRTMTE
jgi:two-component system sensor histidine kinase YesM